MREDRTYLITGGAGFIGSHLCDKYTREGHTVLCLDNFMSGDLRHIRHLLNSHNFKLIRGDIRDTALLGKLVPGVDIVFHLAAQTIVTIANRNPMATFATIIEGTWNLLEACRRNPTVKRIIVASSDKAYGEHEVLPYKEEAALMGSHPYDVSKSCADLIAFAFHNTYQLPVCVTRCGNFYGGGDLNFTRIVPGTIRSVIFNEPVEIRSDGTLIRDYIYILDAVGAYLFLAEKMEKLPIIVTDDGFTKINENGKEINCATEWKDLGAFEDLLVERLIR